MLNSLKNGEGATRAKTMGAAALSTHLLRKTKLLQAFRVLDELEANQPSLQQSQASAFSVVQPAAGPLASLLTTHASSGSLSLSQSSTSSSSQISAATVDSIAGSNEADTAAVEARPALRSSLFAFSQLLNVGAVMQIFHTFCAPQTAEVLH